MLSFENPSYTTLSALPPNSVRPTTTCDIIIFTINVKFADPRLFPDYTVEFHYFLRITLTNDVIWQDTIDPFGRAATNDPDVSGYDPSARYVANDPYDPYSYGSDVIYREDFNYNAEYVYDQRVL
jgi:hypothetical protein